MLFRSRERAFIGEGEGGVIERMRTRHQLLRMRRATQEAEVGNAMEFGVGRDGGEHGAAACGDAAGSMQGVASARLASKAVERAGCGAGCDFEHMGVDHGGADVAMAEQLLHGADVDAALKQVGRE